METEMGEITQIGDFENHYETVISFSIVNKRYWFK